MDKYYKKIAAPFLTWVGGKSQMLNEIERLLPDVLKKGEVQTYIEPFAGAGALFFWISNNYKVNKSVLIDINKDLIMCYKMIQQYPFDMISNLENLKLKFNSLTQNGRSNMYYSIRELYNRNKDIAENEFDPSFWISRSSSFIFLNKTCFKGVYRVNKKGYYNVPFGLDKSYLIYSDKNILAVSRALSNTELIWGDFSICKEYVDSNSFVYFDPPYRAISHTSHFTSYHSDEFTHLDQIRLSDLYKNLHTANVSVMLSNSDPSHINTEDDFLHVAYSGFNIKRVKAKRSINNHRASSNDVFELLITNYS